METRGENIIDPLAYLDIDKLIDDIQTTMNEKLVAYNQWLVENPQAIPQDDLTFQARRHELKMLRSKLQEYKQMKIQYTSSQKLSQDLDQPPVNTPPNKLRLRSARRMAENISNAPMTEPTYVTVPASTRIIQMPRKSVTVTCRQNTPVSTRKSVHMARGKTANKVSSTSQTVSVTTSTTIVNPVSNFASQY